MIGEDFPVVVDAVLIPNQGPRYRYREEAPERITVPAAELLERLPAEYRAGEAAPGARVDLPCRELLGGNTPRLALGVLADLLPDAVTIPEGVDRLHHLPLPPDWLALHYRLIVRREEVAPSPAALNHDAPPVVDAGERRPEPKHAESAPSIQTNGAPGEESTDPLLDPEQPSQKDAKEASPSGEAPDRAVPANRSAPQNPAPVMTDSPGKTAARRGRFSTWPIFRRHHPEPGPDPLPQSSIAEALPVPVKPEPGPESRADVPSGRDSLPVAVETLWKLDPRDPLADPTALQALFMTEEKLTLEQVIGMAGQLPGLNACVLAHGDNVVCASNATPGVDLRTLSEQAMTMLSQIRISSAQMGLGKVPAVTLHADRGIVSFLHDGELCLMVLHAERGFVPGVRERLQEMLGHLVSARPALPGGLAGSSGRLT